ncbi:type II toxin-antitoxin system VapC family toxin [Thiocapsa bogorovii]|uniref:type II toxin-antitoxin system VapC family toxin n=1 Tax=Thiocapsa bogorovii TaxID=521689 RepID=UPI001E50C350|nr:type II toxin-antitoxin system VapC family toxin [Thiocapsa bogorovii]UHD16987.1 type II toxin-antitoxin system VapC family toxin [Thiocapsa bogorovii]
MTLVLDASSLLAFLHDEPGAERVRSAFAGALVSAVNWSEVVQKSLQRQVNVSGMRQEFIEVGVIFVPFTEEQAEIAAYLWNQTRHQGLSLADRACLALAIERKRPILTADRVWSELGLDLDILPIR